MRLKRLSWTLLIFIITFLLGISGCSSKGNSENAKMNDSSKVAMDSAKSGGENSVAFSNEQPNKVPTETPKLDVPSQMVIYQADLQLRVEKFEKTVRILEENVVKYGGYIAESNVNKEGKEQMSGSIKIRIPQNHFQDFLHVAEGQAAEVLKRDIKGQDVTAEYVDLGSRLKSKQVVEERLTAFMKDATKTEDLLKISSDLAAVQEEIEIIEGKMKFLENQTALSTITISLFENKIIVPSIENEKLNTWEKTKKQFMNSTNVLLAALSGLVVLIIGNLPILIILSIIGILIFLFINKIKKRNRRE
ncbi:MAG TPA: DUF4349 domain-containing protein [Neobacillus sp.]|jgi:hypothetical protein